MLISLDQFLRVNVKVRVSKQKQEIMELYPTSEDELEAITS